MKRRKKKTEKAILEEKLKNVKLKEINCNLTSQQIKIKNQLQLKNQFKFYK